LKELSSRVVIKRGISVRLFKDEFGLKSTEVVKMYIGLIRKRIHNENPSVYN
jgi:hypothetical protein